MDLLSFEGPDNTDRADGRWKQLNRITQSGPNRIHHTWWILEYLAYTVVNRTENFYNPTPDTLFMIRKLARAAQVLVYCYRRNVIQCQSWRALSRFCSALVGYAASLW